MSRAIILPTPGDPYVIREWLSNFASWRRDDDVLYIGVSWPIDDAISEWLIHFVDDKALVAINSLGLLDHGQMLQYLLGYVSEDTILLMEDDLFVRDPVELERISKLVEDGEVDVAGIPRRNGSEELSEAMKGFPALWPSMLIAKTTDLWQLTEPWTARIWRAGEKVKGLDYYTQRKCTSDTGVAATLELRSIVDQVEHLPELNAMHAPSSWFHVGSVSTGPFPITGDNVKRARGERETWAARVAWWERCWAAWTLVSDPYVFPNAEKYDKQGADLADAIGPTLMKHWRDRYDELVNWNESCT